MNLKKQIQNEIADQGEKLIKAASFQMIPVIVSIYNTGNPIKKSRQIRGFIKHICCCFPRKVMPKVNEDTSTAV